MSSHNVQLFCIPHAAGSASMYVEWKNRLPKSVELVPLELAGRGRKFNQPLYNDFEEAAADLYNELIQMQSGQPYAIFGHSMGSLLGYELAMRAQENGHPPHVLFLAGQNPPHHFRGVSRYSAMSDDELWSFLLEGSQTPWDEHEHGQQIREMYLPILKADLRLCDTYHHIKGRKKYGSQLVVMNGAKDSSVVAEEKEWHELVDISCMHEMFPGGHYFVYEDQEHVIETVVHYLKGVI
ncbi:alpha/beta fold hydrolase [Paenibacillus sp. AN1007]|uniref:Alpha/beta fold hydrolase n=1 Tax=Paenibacillus sp. AN1007 TaxID=3151385 RepID=A0AAU8NN02_9BACL